MRSAWICCLLLLGLAVACSSVDAPRWSESAELPAETVDFESPRQYFEVEQNPDIGDVALRGTVRGASSIAVFAPADGRVIDVVFARGEMVSDGDKVLTLNPAPTEADLIALDIAELDVEFAIATGASAAEIADLEAARDELAASYEARTISIQAPAAGAIGPTRQNIAYTVREGDLLFELQDPTNLVVIAEIDRSEADAVLVGTPVTLTAPGVTTETLTGRLAEIIDTGSSAGNGDGDVAAAGDGGAAAGLDLLIELDDSSLVALGDRLTVSLAVEAGQSGASAHWVPLDAVGRQDGVPFVLISDVDDQLRRLEVSLGRRTLSHVQVLGGVEAGMRLAAPQ